MLSLSIVHVESIIFAPLGTDLFLTTFDMLFLIILLSSILNFLFPMHCINALYGIFVVITFCYSTNFIIQYFPIVFFCQSIIISLLLLQCLQFLQFIIGCMNDPSWSFGSNCCPILVVSSWCTSLITCIHRYFFRISEEAIILTSSSCDSGLSNVQIMIHGSICTTPRFVFLK